MHYEVRRHTDDIYQDLVRHYWMGSEIKNWFPDLMEQLVEHGYCVPDPDDENFYIFSVYPKPMALNKMVAYHNKVLPLGRYLTEYEKSSWSARKRLRIASNIFVGCGILYIVFIFTPFGQMVLTRTALFARWLFQ